jgi:hypothetical protein
MGDQQHRQQVRRASDRLLHAVDDLKAAERKKRSERMSTPAFHRLADEVRVKADKVWRAAVDEEDAGDRLTEAQAETTEDQSPN